MTDRLGKAPRERRALDTGGRRAHANRSGQRPTAPTFDPRHLTHERVVVTDEHGVSRAEWRRVDSGRGAALDAAERGETLTVTDRAGRTFAVTLAQLDALRLRERKRKAANAVKRERRALAAERAEWAERARPPERVPLDVAKARAAAERRVRGQAVKAATAKAAAAAVKGAKVLPPPRARKARG